MNNVPIRDADGNKQAIATLETSSGQHTQRTLAQTIVGGAPMDVSASAPVPVSGPATDAQLRATPLPIDTELPPAAAPSDADANAAVPAVAARSQLWDATTNRWRLPQVAADGRSAQAFPGQVPMVYDPAIASCMIARNARSTTDADSGLTFTPSGSMLSNGATWARARQAADNMGTVGVPAGLSLLWNDATSSGRLPRGAASVADAEDGRGFAPTANMLFNGTSWERQRLHGVNLEYLPLTTITASWSAGATIATRGARGVMVMMAVKNFAGAGAKLELQVESGGAHQASPAGYGFAPRASAVDPTAVLNGHGYAVRRQLIYPGISESPSWYSASSGDVITTTNAVLPGDIRPVVYATGTLTADITLRYVLVP